VMDLESRYRCSRCGMTFEIVKEYAGFVRNLSKVLCSECAMPFASGRSLADKQDVTCYVREKCVPVTRG